LHKFGIDLPINSNTAVRKMSEFSNVDENFFDQKSLGFLKHPIQLFGDNFDEKIKSACVNRLGIFSKTSPIFSEKINLQPVDWPAINTADTWSAEKRSSIKRGESVCF